MSGGQHYSKYQKGIINRYYEHADSRLATALQELVGEVFLAEPGSKSADKLWDKARQTLGKCGVNDAKAERVLTARDVQGLAALVHELTAPGKAVAKPRPTKGAGG